MTSEKSALVSHVPIARRFIWYGAVWLFAALAIQIFLKPEGLTETNLSEIQQRIRWPLYTPVMAIVGLAEAFTWPGNCTVLAALFAGGCFVVHAIVTITRSRRGSLVSMLCVQVVLTGAAVIYFIRFSRLASCE